jgi:hypothetical protein
VSGGFRKRLTHPTPTSDDDNGIDERRDGGFVDGGGFQGAAARAVGLDEQWKVSGAGMEGGQVCGLQPGGAAIVAKRAGEERDALGRKGFGQWRAG